MEVTKYTLCQIRIEGMKPFFANGIKLSEEVETESQYHGASRNPFSVIFKKRKIEFEILEPEDHAQLNTIHRRCVDDGEFFTIIGFAQDENKNWVAMEKLSGCVIPGRERTLGQHESIKLGIKGFAMDTEPINAAYD